MSLIKHKSCAADANLLTAILAIACVAIVAITLCVSMVALRRAVARARPRDTEPAALQSVPVDPPPKVETRPATPDFMAVEARGRGDKDHVSTTANSERQLALPDGFKYE